MAEARAVIRMVLNKGDGSIVNLNQAVDSLLSFVRTKAIDFGDSRRIRNITHALVKMTDFADSTNLDLILLAAEEIDAPFIEQDRTTITGSGPVFFKAGSFPYWKFEFRDTGVQELWKLGGFEVWGEDEGERF